MVCVSDGELNSRCGYIVLTSTDAASFKGMPGYREFFRVD